MPRTSQTSSSLVKLRPGSCAGNALFFRTCDRQIVPYRPCSSCLCSLPALRFCACTRRPCFLVLKPPAQTACRMAITLVWEKRHSYTCCFPCPFAGGFPFAWLMTLVSTPVLAVLSARTGDFGRCVNPLPTNIKSYSARARRSVSSDNFPACVFTSKFFPSFADLSSQSFLCLARTQIAACYLDVHIHGLLAISS